MKNETLFTFSVFVLILLLSVCSSTQEVDEEIWQQALIIHDKALVLDAHAHPLIFRRGGRDDYDPSRATDISQNDFITMKKGGLDGFTLSLPFFDEKDADNPTKKILDDAALVRDHLNAHASLAELALCADDIQRIDALGKRAILLGIEFGGCLEGKIETLDAYYKAGIRMITLRSDETDPMDTSDGHEVGESGLSAYGKDIVRRMNRLGMIIDITHVPDQLQRDIVKASKAPVIASHSCARALVNIPRNIPDPILQEIAQNGGAVMTTFYSGFLSNEYRARSEKADKRIEEEKKQLEQQLRDDPAELEKRVKDLEETFKPKRADIASLIDHVDHGVKVAGIDHVGVGSDFGGTNTPIGLESSAGFPRITYHLLMRGYTEDQIDKIMGGNLLRVIQEIEDLSMDMRSSRME